MNPYKQLPERCMPSSVLTIAPRDDEEERQLFIETRQLYAIGTGENSENNDNSNNNNDNNNNKNSDNNSSNNNNNNNSDSNSDSDSGDSYSYEPLTGIEHLFDSMDGSRPLAPRAPFVRDPLGSPHGLSEQIAQNVAVGMVSFWQRDLAKTIDILLPYKVYMQLYI